MPLILSHATTSKHSSISSSIYTHMFSRLYYWRQSVYLSIIKHFRDWNGLLQGFLQRHRNNDTVGLECPVVYGKAFGG